MPVSDEFPGSVFVPSHGMRHDECGSKCTTRGVAKCIWCRDLIGEAHKLCMTCSFVKHKCFCCGKHIESLTDLNDDMIRRVHQRGREIAAYKRGLDRGFERGSSTPQGGSTSLVDWLPVDLLSRKREVVIVITAISLVSILFCSSD